MKKSYSSAERKSYKRGFFAGLFASKKKKKVVKKPAVKRKQSPSVWHNQHIEDPLYLAAYRYADFPRKKYGSPEDLVLPEARKYYERALKDDKFRNELVNLWGSY